MVKCPKCGFEYSLGTRIYHSCEDYSICHGVIFEKERISRPWNCNPIGEREPLHLEPKKEIKMNEEFIYAIKKINFNP